MTALAHRLFAPDLAILNRRDPQLVGYLLTEFRRLQDFDLRPPAQDPSDDFLETAQFENKFQLIFALFEPLDLLARMPASLGDEADGPTFESHSDANLFVAVFRLMPDAKASAEMISQIEIGWAQKP